MDALKVEKKRVLVVGMARSGIAAAQLLMHNGGIPILSDAKNRRPSGMTGRAEGYLLRVPLGRTR